jgi:hypothetical protein
VLPTPTRSDLPFAAHHEPMKNKWRAPISVEVPPMLLVQAVADQPVAPALVFVTFVFLVLPVVASLTSQW